MNREQQRQKALLQMRQALAIYKASERNAQVVADKMDLSRERIRQILNNAMALGIMNKEDKRTPFDSERWFPTILRIIKSGGDIFDIVEESKLSPQRIAWCLRMLKKRKLITKRQHKEVSLYVERSRITYYLKKDNLSSKIINELYNDGRIWQANTLYYHLIGKTEINNHIVVYHNFYYVISRLHHCGVLSRHQRGMYEINPCFALLLEKYLKMKQKGDLSVTKQM